MPNNPSFPFSSKLNGVKERWRERGKKKNFPKHDYFKLQSLGISIFKANGTINQLRMLILRSQSFFLPSAFHSYHPRNIDFPPNNLPSLWRTMEQQTSPGIILELMTLHSSFTARDGFRIHVDHLTANAINSNRTRKRTTRQWRWGAFRSHRLRGKGQIN